MNKEKTYILQQDLPNLKSGTEFTFSKGSSMYESTIQDDWHETTFYKKELIENSDWFKEKVEEKPFVVNFYGEGNTKINFKYRLYNDFPDKEFIISKERLQEILIAENKGELFINGNEQVWLRFGKEKLYTEKEWLQFGEECWNAAREQRLPKHNEIVIRSPYPDRYETLSDYLNDLQK